MTAPEGAAPAPEAVPGARVFDAGNVPRVTQAGRAEPWASAAAGKEAGGLDAAAELARLADLPLAARAAALTATVERLGRELDATERAAPGA